ncbi:hypothetical protein Tco_0756728 [Tanacetum coccineum]
MSAAKADPKSQMYLDELEIGVIGFMIVMVCRIWDVNATTGRYLSTAFVIGEQFRYCFAVLGLLPNVDILAIGKRKLDDRVAPTSDPLPIPQIRCLDVRVKHVLAVSDNANVKAHEMSPISTCFQLTATKEGVGNSDDRPEIPVSISSVKYFPILTAIDTDMALTVVMLGHSKEHWQKLCCLNGEKCLQEAKL